MAANCVVGFASYQSIPRFLSYMAARGDLIRKLFRSFSENDREEFYAAARELIEEERNKNHLLLANDLEKSLQLTTPAKRVASNGSPWQNYPEVPTAKDTGLPLIAVKQYELTWEDVILTEKNRQILETVVLENRKQDILSAHNLKPRSTLLFCGPPGCGKTLTAQILGSVLFLPLVYVNLSAVFSSYLGETALNLKLIFDYIEKGQWVVLFDEFDAIGKDRNAANEHGEIKRVVNSLLQLIDSANHNSIFVAATNHSSMLDSAIWRRFDEVLLFEKPSQELIISLLLKNLGSIRHEIKVEQFAQGLEGATGADIERICQNAIKSVILSGEKVLKSEDLEAAIQHHQDRMEVITRSQKNQEFVTADPNGEL
jgi:SpoVK/Ycf46/Vps4 family AAA+-type ATPase